MTRVAQMQVTCKNDMYSELDDLCFRSKNLYNATLYEVRQAFFATNRAPSYEQMNALFRHEKRDCYTALPAKVSQQTQKLVDQAFKSYFALKKADTSGTDKVRLPRYLDKKRGRQVVLYLKQALRRRGVPKNWIGLSKTNLSVPLPDDIRQDDVRFVRIVPRRGYITVEIGYDEKPCTRSVVSGKHVMAIDLGVNNLATIVSTADSPLIVNGRPLKSVNQFYNKRKAAEQGRIRKRHGKWTSRRIDELGRWRKNHVDQYIHAVTRCIANYAASLDVGTVLIGRNQGWKQSVNMGRHNNQEFVQIPFDSFIHRLTYKCEEMGIQVITGEESYTSRASALDRDVIPTYGAPGSHGCRFSGKRICRGLYRSSDGTVLNADVNGAINIGMKLHMSNVADVDDFYRQLVEACSRPRLLTVGKDGLPVVTGLNHVALDGTFQKAVI